MSEELKKIIDDVLDMDFADDCTQIDFSIVNGMDCVLDVSVRKVRDSQYSFGYDVRTKSIVNKLECGTNTFKGDVERLFLGFTKSLFRVEAVSRYSMTRQRVAEIVTYVSDIVPPPQEDESKVNLGKWQIPITFNKNFLR